MHLRIFTHVAAALVVVSAVTTAAASRQDVSQRLVDARAARDAGQYDKALNLVEAVVAQSPANAPAARLKVEILLAQTKLELALTAYDRYVSARRQPDLVLLGVIATSVLQRLGEAPDPGISVPALERLARFGDVKSRQALGAGLIASQPAVIANLSRLVSLARLGDVEAERSLGSLLASVPAQDKFAVLEAIGEAGARTQAQRVAGLLTDSDPTIRIAAARALGTLLVPQTAPQLQAAFDTDLPTVQMFAGIALKRLGQTSADAHVAKLLASEVTEVRLLAGWAYQTSKSTQWVSRIRDLQTDRNDRHRVQVAELLACCDVPTAKSLLLAAVGSPNPLLRRDGARVLESKALADAAMVRRLLGDSDELVRLMGAGAALSLAQRPPPSR